MTLFIACPLIVIGSIDNFRKREHHERPEFVAYDFLRIRTKKFPWGDGNHTLFHNPRTNALPTGYEE